jgi:hypothetical protein
MGLSLSAPPLQGGRVWHDFPGRCPGLVSLRTVGAQDQARMANPYAETPPDSRQSARPT